MKGWQITSRTFLSVLVCSTWRRARTFSLSSTFTATSCDHCVRLEEEPLFVVEEFVVEDEAASFRIWHTKTFPYEPRPITPWYSRSDGRKFRRSRACC